MEKRIELGQGTIVSIMEPIAKHKSDFRWRILMPVLAPLLLLIISLIALLVLALRGNITGQQINVIAGIMMTIFVLCPMAILTLIPAGLLIWIAFSSDNLYDWTAPPLRKVRHWTTRGAEITHQLSERITEPVIKGRARYDSWLHTINEFLGIPEVEQEQTGEQSSEQ